VRLGGWASGMGLTMLDSMAPWLQLGRIGQLTWWTAWLWGSGVVINLLVLQALDIPGSPLMALTLLVLLTLGARVPAGPANIGVFESLCVVGLDWFGVKPGLALSYGFALHVVVLLPGLIGGAWVVWHDATIWAGVRGAADREQSGV
jgi:uncharacterized membrane protein YbhN (UPF0104 family)